MPPAGEEAIPTRYHFLRGHDPDGWRRDVPAYASLRYAGLYEGVDLKVYGQGQTLEYDAILDPGADLAQVEIRCQGVQEMRLTEDGTLILLTPLGEIRQRPPRTFQVAGTGEKELLECRYRLIGKDAFGFEVKGRDESLALLIDPVLEWCTYLGGKKEDRILGLDMDANGVVTVTGDTKSDATFPTTFFGYQPFYGGGFGTPSWPGWIPV